VSELQLRPAQLSDLDNLVNLENASFQSDRISARSLRRFIKSSQDDLLVAVTGGELLGYLLLLYRKGTNLARIYSLAVDAKARGRGIAQQLLQQAEQVARDRASAFIRLEVSINNQPAIELYKRMGFHTFGRIAGYYGDGSDAIRMVRAIRRAAKPEPSTCYYEQTTPFSCGPASLLMAMNRLSAHREMTRSEELAIWREATTIYMTSGHGGCSPVGIALAAKRRGFSPTLFLSTESTPFIDSVRDLDKKSVIEQVHLDYLSELNHLGAEIHYQTIEPADLVQRLKEGAVAISLISTWRLNRNKAPHWVLLSGADDRFIYLCDPDMDHDEWHTKLDYIDVPVALDEFQQMSRYGRERLSATILITL
jgi:ribosomal protein S18 acetylase RimI-like enzyme